jgi:DNA-binding NtrC family response regulator
MVTRGNENLYSLSMTTHMTICNEIRSSAPGTMTPVIYVVDDMPELTALYTAVLETAGYTVRAFNDRAEALTALQADLTKPHLLITDCFGRPMPVDRFICHCRAVHPALRILMASGLSPMDESVTNVRTDRFIHKPFTLDELQQEVSAALAA